MPGIQAFFDDATSTASFLVWDRETKAAAVIDAVLDFDSATGKLSTTSADTVSYTHLTLPTKRIV